MESNIKKILSKRNQNPKVILSTNYYYPQLGGITTSVDNLNKVLNQNYFDSKVYAFPYLFRKIENLFKNLTIRNLFHKFFVLVYTFYGLLIVLIYRLSFRRVIVHGQSANFCALFAYLSGFLGAKSVFTFRTDILLRELELSKKIEPSNVFYLNKIHKLTAVSNFLEKQAMKYYKLKVQVKTVYEGVSYTFCRSSNCKKIKNTVLFVGNLNKIKDPRTFIESIKILKKSGLKVNAKIIGTGELKNEVNKKIIQYGLKNQITLIGTVGHDKIKKYYDESLVYVSSSLGEGLPNTVLEAIASDDRIVATSVGGIPEVGIEEHNCGTLIPPKNPVLMAKAIKSELKKKPSKQSINILKKFDRLVNIRQYGYLYNNLYIKHPRRGNQS